MYGFEAEKKLLDRLYDFQAYLGLEQLWEFKLVSFGSNELMRQAAKERSIAFNRDFLQKPCDDRFSFLVFAHEAYHVMKQGLIHPSQVNKIRDGVGWLLMQLLDVEADLIAAKYLKEKEQVCLSDYLLLHQKGAHFFLNITPRRPKFERFVGTMLSVHRLFQQQEQAIYLPDIATPFTMGLSLIKQTQGLTFYTGEGEYPFEFISSFERFYRNQPHLSFDDFSSNLAYFIEGFQNFFTCFANTLNIKDGL